MRIANHIYSTKSLHCSVPSFKIFLQICNPFIFIWDHLLFHNAQINILEYVNHTLNLLYVHGNASNALWRISIETKKVDLRIIIECLKWRPFDGFLLAQATPLCLMVKAIMTRKENDH